jgi:MFS family permease
VIRKSLIGAAAAVAVVLVGRSLAYAAEPSATARLLQHRVVGPQLLVLACVALTLGAAVAIAVSALAALAVKERALLERRRPTEFPVRRLLLLAVALSVVTCLGGGLFEAYLHWRAGLGWHGMHCVFGPLHRDLLPIDTGLSFVVAALLTAARHVLAWMRRTFARLRGVPPRIWASPRQLRPRVLPVPRSTRIDSAPARAPPVPA